MDFVTYTDKEADDIQTALKQRIPAILDSIKEMGFKYCNKLELYISPDEVYIYLSEGSRNIQKHLQLSPKPFVKYAIRLKGKKKASSLKIRYIKVPLRPPDRLGKPLAPFYELFDF